MSTRKLENFFVPEDFRGQLGNYEEHVAKLANAKLAREVEKWQVVVSNKATMWCEVEFDVDNPTHTARLAFIQPIVKPECTGPNGKHEPKEVELHYKAEGGVFNHKLGTFEHKLINESKTSAILNECRHCGAKLKMPERWGKS